MTPLLLVPPKRTEVARPDSAELDCDERRAAARLTPDLVPSITGVRLSPCRGTTVLVNISTSGLVVKGDTRLLLGTGVTVVLEGTFVPSSIKGRVARCGVTAIEHGRVWYHIGVAFDHPISLGQPESVANPAVLFNRW